MARELKPLAPYALQNVTINGAKAETVTVKKDAKLFADLDSLVTDLATEVEGLQAYVMTSKIQRNDGTVITFTADKPVTLLVGFFRDDQTKYAKAPRLEIDATASEYGQQDPCFTSAIRIKGMPQVNIHPYHLTAGTHELHLPKGFLLVLGATTDKISPRDAALSGADSSIDWLFY